MTGKLYLRELPANHDCKTVITPSGIFNVKMLENGVHHLEKDGVEFQHFGKVYQMCFIDFHSREAFKVPEKDWRLCTKYIPRIEGKLVIGLSNKGVIHTQHKLVSPINTNGEYIQMFRSLV